jgi:transcriptional regulator with XRE-family HTH domain
MSTTERLGVTNERLRAAIHQAGFSAEGIAEQLGVDRKTVWRWIAGQVPYKKHQHAVAGALGVDPGYLWPPSGTDESKELALAEIRSVWPQRSFVPNSAWLDLFERAEQQIDILVHAGFWLSEDPAVRQLLVRKAKARVRVRLLLGDPASSAVQIRGDEEGIGPAIAAKIQNTIHNYRGLLSTANTELRLHSTTLYASVYRADDEMLVSTHIYGLPGHMAPLMHLQRVPGAAGLFAAYLDGVERVWDQTAADGDLVTPLRAV